MLKTISAASLVAALAMSPLAAVGQTDQGAAPMMDKGMSDTKKPMMKHHSMPVHHHMHQKAMAKPMMHPEAPKAM